MSLDEKPENSIGENGAVGSPAPSRTISTERAAAARSEAAPAQRANVVLASVPDWCSSLPVIAAGRVWGCPRLPHGDMMVFLPPCVAVPGDRIESPSVRYARSEFCH